MSKVQFKRGEVYSIDLGETKGSEIKKVRPCIIVQNDIGNRFAPTIIVIPITHRHNKKLPTQLQLQDFMLEEATKKIDGMIMSEQIRTVDKSRVLSPRIGKLTRQAIEMVDRAILISMGIEVPV